MRIHFLHQGRQRTRHLLYFCLPTDRLQTVKRFAPSTMIESVLTYKKERMVRTALQHLQPKSSHAQAQSDMSIVGIHRTAP
jgi:hypothetical protein